jgi:hypothetical protein
MCRLGCFWADQDYAAGTTLTSSVTAWASRSKSAGSPWRANAMAARHCCCASALRCRGPAGRRRAGPARRRGRFGAGLTGERVLGPPLFSVANGRVLSDDNFVFFNNLRSLDGSERVHPNREPGGRRGDRPLRLVRGGFHGDRDGVRRVVPARVGVEIPSRRPGLRLCVAERGQPTIRPSHTTFTGGHRCAVLRPRPCAAPGVAESGDAETALGEAAGVASVDRPRQRSHARKPTAQRLPGAVGTATIDCRWPFGLASCGG